MGGPSVFLTSNIDAPPEASIAMNAGQERGVTQGRANRSIRRRHLFLTRASFLIAIIIGAGCNKQPPPEPSNAPATASAATKEQETSAEAVAAAESFRRSHTTKTTFAEHPAGSVWVFEAGKEPRKIPIANAESEGFAVVDLSDSWVPFVFSDKTPGIDDAKPNRYAKHFVGLANDKIDADGDRLPNHAHNYLELYGIPPSLSVVLEEWREAESDLTACLEQHQYNPEIFRTYRGVLAFEPHRGPKRVIQAKKAQAALAKAMKQAKLASDAFEEAAEHPKTQAIYKRWHDLSEEVELVKQAQIRFGCERLFPTNKGLGRPQPGNFDSHVHMALAAFEKKHNLMGWGHFAPDNLNVLALSPNESTHARFLRAVRQRVVASVGVVEDGSAATWKPSFRWKDKSGQEQPLRDVAGEMSEAFIEALNLRDPVQARSTLDRLEHLEEKGFASLLVGVKLPPVPEYYQPDMEFEVIIHRGDVWYDIPYDAEGKAIEQRRKYFPHITVYTNYNNQKIPLVHWRTTIGSWRSEEHDGQEWLVYKNSDVGERVWRDIVAAPTWIPPNVTPVRTLVKWKTIKRNRVQVVNYDDTGPGFASAYGLVAAYHVKLTYDENGEIIREWDNMIRTHGSVDYMSILKRFSHGCHRLYNMRAVELFSFILQHAEFTRHGQIPLGYRREFEYNEKKFTMDLGTRGYRYELKKPIAVNVLEGRIRGKRKTPYEVPIEKPGYDYGDPLSVDEEDTSVDDANDVPPTGESLPQQ
jgi:hypothetical protein